MISHVTVVPMDSRRHLRDHTVVVDRGRVDLVARSADVVPPARAVHIDGTGLHLMPGLADMHAHYGESGQFIMYLANGVTRLRNMFGNRFHLELRRRIAAGAFPGPHLFTTGPITDGPLPDGRGAYPGGAVVSDASQAAPLVSGLVANGYQALKVYSLLSPDSLRALGAAARDAGLPMVGHCPTAMSFEEAMDAGLYSFEHLVEIGNGHLRDGVTLPPFNDLRDKLGLIRRMELTVEAVDREAVRRLAGTMAARGVWNCPTLAVQEIVAQPAATSTTEPALEYLSTSAREQGERRTRVPSDAGCDEATWRAPLRAYVEMLSDLTGILHEEGAPLLLGTDAGSPMTVQGFTIHRELNALVEAGLSPYEALRSGTVEAARSLGESQEWGTITVGKAADLLLVDGDPLANVDAVRSLRAVVSNGFLFDRPQLDRLLAWRRSSADASADLPDDQVGPMATREWFAR